MSPPIVGQSVTLQATFKDSDGELVNPVSVTLTVEAPDGTTTTPTPTTPSVGVYQHTLSLNEAGDWDFRWEGTTAEGTAVCEGRVCASPSALTSTSP